MFCVTSSEVALFCQGRGNHSNKIPWTWHQEQEVLFCRSLTLSSAQPCVRGIILSAGPKEKQRSYYFTSWFSTVRFFLLGKSLVIMDKPATLEHLKTNIQRALTEITSGTCENVIENHLKRIDSFRMSKSGHLTYVFFICLIINTKYFISK